MRVPPMVQAPLLSYLPLRDRKRSRNSIRHGGPWELFLAACAPGPGRKGRAGNLPVRRGAQVFRQSTKRQSALLLCISTVCCPAPAVAREACGLLPGRQD